MAGLDETEEIAARNARNGMILFLMYLAVYSAYVLLNAFEPAVMDAVPLLGVFYGVGLIVLALVLALVYAWLCRPSFPSHPTCNESNATSSEEPPR